MPLQKHDLMVHGTEVIAFATKLQLSIKNSEPRLVSILPENETIYVLEIE